MAGQRWRWLVLVPAAAAFVAVVAVRHGPPPGGDTVPLTAVVTDLSHGQLVAAARVDSLPNPPGYPLLVAPLVAALRPWVGSPVWCPTPDRAAPRRGVAASLHGPSSATGGSECGARPRLDGAARAGADRGASGAEAGSGTLIPPPWYRSQGVLGVLAWVVLAAATVALLGATGVGNTGSTVAALGFLVLLPAASGALVQLYHPQDLVSLALCLLAMAAGLRERWVWAGVLLGVAFLSKQFAVLVLVPLTVAAPGRRDRVRLLVAAGAVAVAALAPFALAAPHATLTNLSGFGAGGAVTGTTVLSLLHGSGTLASAIARDAPVVFAVAVCPWLRRRTGSSLRRPVPLLGLVLVCLASRLVFESVIFPYYLLAASVVFFALDLAARRLPYRSMAWCAVSAAFVGLHPANRAVAAFGTLALAVVAVAAGWADAVSPTDAAASDASAPPAPIRPWPTTGISSLAAGRDDPGLAGRRR